MTERKRTLYIYEDITTPKEYRWWAAWHEPDVTWYPVGHGPTEQDAVIDLVTQYDFPSLEEPK